MSDFEKIRDGRSKGVANCGTLDYTFMQSLLSELSTRTTEENANLNHSQELSAEVAVKNTAGTCEIHS
jgi:hypothetical protein